MSHYTCRINPVFAIPPHRRAKCGVKGLLTNGQIA